MGEFEIIFSHIDWPKLFFTTHSQKPLLYLQQMALLGFLLSPYAAAGFEPTSVNRAVPDWDLRGMLYQLSYSAAAMDPNLKSSSYLSNDLTKAEQKLFYFPACTAGTSSAAPRSRRATACRSTRSSGCSSSSCPCPPPSSSWERTFKVRGRRRPG